jgi:hypothetical protein
MQLTGARQQQSLSTHSQVCNCLSACLDGGSMGVESGGSLYAWIVFFRIVVNYLVQARVVVGTHHYPDPR